jgi:transposase
MKHYAGIDVSLERSCVCVVDAAGTVVREAKAPSEPEALVRLLREFGLEFERIGLEAGPLSQWLHAGLAAAGFDVVLLETRHVKAALSAMWRNRRPDSRVPLIAVLPSVIHCSAVPRRL